MEWERVAEMEEAARLRNLASACRPPPEPRVINKKRVRGAYTAPDSEDEDFDLEREARELTPEMGQAYREDKSHHLWVFSGLFRRWAMMIFSGLALGVQSPNQKSGAVSASLKVQGRVLVI
jgi:hypothetical protein